MTITQENLLLPSAYGGGQVKWPTTKFCRSFHNLLDRNGFDIVKRTFEDGEVVRLRREYEDRDATRIKYERSIHLPIRGNDERTNNCSFHPTEVTWIDNVPRMSGTTLINQLKNSHTGCADIAIHHPQFTLKLFQNYTGHTLKIGDSVFFTPETTQYFTSLFNIRNQQIEGPEDHTKTKFYTPHKGDLLSNLGMLEEILQFAASLYIIEDHKEKEDTITSYGAEM